MIRKRRSSRASAGLTIWCAKRLGAGLGVLLICGPAIACAVAQGEPPPAAVVEPDPQRTQVPLAEIEGVGDLAAPVPCGLDTKPELRQRYETAVELVGEQEFQEAVNELNAILSQPGGVCYEVVLLMARAQSQLKRYGAARLAGLQAARLQPGQPEVYHLLGQLCMSQGRLEEAVGYLRTATSLGGEDPADADAAAAWYTLGDCLSQIGYSRAAAEALERFDRDVWERHPEYRSAAEIAPILAQHPHGAIERRLELLRALDRPEECISAAKWAVESRPDEPYLQRLYVRTLLAADQPGEAFEYCRQRLEAAAKEDTDEAGGFALLTLAIEAARRAGRFDAWAAQLEDDLAQGRQTVPALRLARRLDEAGEYEFSARVWKALAHAQPDSVDAVWGLARARKESGDLRGALDALIEFVRRTADEVEIPPGRLEDWMRSFDVTDEFLALVKTLTAREDCDFATYTVLGMTAAAAGEAELGEQLFASALENRPGFALAHVGWGRMLLAAYRWESAKAHAEQALETAPDLAAAHLLAAEAYSGLDENEQADEEYKAAVAQRPDDVGCILALARHCRRTGKPLAAQRHFQQAWSLDHTCAEAIEELVASYLGANKLEIARACIQEAEASDLPADVLRRLRTTLRFAAAPLGKEHLAELTRQLDEHPDDSRTALTLAAGCYIRGEADRGLEVLERSTPRGRDEEHARYLLARIRLRRLEVDQAVAILEGLAGQYPRRESVLGLLSEAYLTGFHLDEARGVLRRLLDLAPTPAESERTRTQLLATYVDFMEYDAALRLVDEWIAAAPDDSRWVQAKLRVLLSAGRGPEAVELATARLGPVTVQFEDVSARYRALGERLREDPDDADLEAQLQALEREMNECFTELWSRRSEYVQVCQEAGQFEPAEQEVRAWLTAHPDVQQLKDWLIELLLGSEKVDQGLSELAGYTAQTPADVVEGLQLAGAGLRGERTRGRGGPRS